MHRNINYRRIYCKHFGSIPVDSDGRTFDIHHLDGDHLNNDPSNLVAISLKEHYDIHWRNGDWGACWAIAKRLKIPKEEVSELVRKQQAKRVEEGKHNFVGDNRVTVFDQSGRCIRVDATDIRLISGELIPVNKGFVVVKTQNGNIIRVLKTDPRIASGELVGINKGSKRPGNGGHGLNKGKKWTHVKKREKVACPHCSKIGDISLMKRHHFDNCKLRNTNES